MTIFMKIGVDIRTLMDARYSGVPEYTLNLLTEIFKLDHENEYRLFYNSGRDISARMPDFGAMNASIIHTRYPNKLLNYFLFKIFNRPRIDNLLGADIFFMPHMNFISLSGRSKSVLTVHDLSFLRYPGYFSARKNFWHGMVDVRKLINKFNCVVAVSENTKQDIVELCGVEGHKVKVIYSGITDDYKVIGKSDVRLIEVRNKYSLPEKFILFLGTIEPRKNITGLVSAFEDLIAGNSELSGLHLVIVGGKGWKSAEIRKKIADSNLEDHIKMLGYVDREDKPYIYNLASLFVYPSLYEGFGFPPLEAMACGVPVITSASSSLPEIVGDAGILVESNNISDISRAMKLVLTDDGLSKKLSAKGIERAKHFNWRNAAQEYLKLFQGL